MTTRGKFCFRLAQEVRWANDRVILLNNPEDFQMKKVMSCVVLGLASFAAVGCGQKATTKSTETIKNPEGKTTIEHEDTVKKSNENAPNP